MKFPLDKFKNLWYNKSVIKRGNLLNIKKNRVATVAKMKGSIMTTREFYNAILSMENVSAEISEKAAALLSAMDKKNAERSSKPTKAQKENEALLPIVREVLATADHHITASDLFDAKPELKNVQKCSSLLRILEKSGEVTSVEVKVKGKGKAKGYSLADAEPSDAEPNNVE